MAETDAAATALLEKVMDRVDGVLFKDGLVFREDKEWHVACGEMAAFIYYYYADEGSYEPGDSAEMMESEESESRTLDSDDESSSQ